MKNKNYTVKDLIKHLEQFDSDLPVIVFREGKEHSYTINGEQIEIMDYAYFGNDSFVTKDTLKSKKFLKIGEA